METPTNNYEKFAAIVDGLNPDQQHFADTTAVADAWSDPGVDEFFETRGASFVSWVIAATTHSADMRIVGRNRTSDTEVSDWVEVAGDEVAVTIAAGATGSVFSLAKFGEMALQFKATTPGENGTLEAHGEKW